MREKSFVFALVFALVFSFGFGARAGGMDDHSAGGGSMMDASYMEGSNKEFVLKSGYYYQKTSFKSSSGQEDYVEHGFSIGFGLSRLLAEHSVAGLDFRSSLRFEPDIMIGFVDPGDENLHHLFLPAFLQADFPMIDEPMELSLGVGTGPMIYDMGDQLDRQTYMPVIGKIAFDYIKTEGVKMGIEGKGHYIINRPNGDVDDFWGISGIFKLSMLF